VSRMSRSQVMLGLILSFLSSAATRAQEKELDTRWKEAEENVKSEPGRHYFTTAFSKEFFSKYPAHLSQCAQKAGPVTPPEMKAAVELGAAGQVLAVLPSDSKAPSCFWDLLKRDVFPKPPSDHFWVPIVVRITKQ
jgi:hypothetical protein